MELSTLQRTSARSFFLSAAFTALVPGLCVAAVAPGEITITEVMANPAAVNDTQGEWFEIYNHSGNALDLSGLVIRDNGSNQHTITDSISVAADSYFVFGRNGDSDSNGGYVADYVYSSFTLSNSSDAIILEYDNVSVASLIYDGGDFGLAGISTELTGTGFSATPQEFIYGDGDSGTPGSAGSDASLEFASAPEVPVPAAGWLMGSALLSLLGWRRK